MFFDSDSFVGKRIKSEMISTVKHYYNCVRKKYRSTAKFDCFFFSLFLFFFNHLFFYYSSSTHVSCVYVYLLNRFCRVFLCRFIIINDCAHKYYSVNTYVRVCVSNQVFALISFRLTRLFVPPRRPTPNPGSYRA